MFSKHFAITILSLLVALAGVPAAQAQVFVQGFDATRDGLPNPFATLGFVGSPYYSAVRQALRNRYGDAVVFGSPSWPDGAPAVTAGVLAEADVFVVTGMSVVLTPEEVCLLDTFVAHGGAVLSFRNEWSLAMLLDTHLGSAAGSGSANVVDAASPVIAGRFGVVASPVQVGFNSEYLPSGAGSPVLADKGRVMLVTFGPQTGHLGRAVIVGDEEIFLNGPTPFGASLRGTLANNQLLFANAMDYLFGAPGLDAAGLNALQACTDRDGDGSNDLEDCDDDAPQTFPGAAELLDGADNDCDGEVDEGLDADGDGVPDLLDSCGDTPASVGVDRHGCEVVCETEVAVDADGDGVPADEDCDDHDSSVHAGAVDLPGNLRDEDCDGELSCDPTGPWKNHGQFVSCVAREVARLRAAGLISAEQAAGLIHDAALVRDASSGR